MSSYHMKQTDIEGGKFYCVYYKGYYEVEMAYFRGSKDARLFLKALEMLEDYDE